MKVGLMRIVVQTYRKRPNVYFLYLVLLLPMTFRRILLDSRSGCPLVRVCGARTDFIFALKHLHTTRKASNSGG